MAKDKFPTTAAIRQLKQHNVHYTPYLYPYEEKGGTRASSKHLEVDETYVIKTLVMEDETKKPLIILMHGNCEVSTKELARTLNVKRISPCTAQTAQKHTGYLVGGTSPFGTLKPLTIYVEQSILALDNIYINGGKRGFLIQLPSATLQNVLSATPVKVAIEH